jgi:hypothetical protein
MPNTPMTRQNAQASSKTGSLRRAGLLFRGRPPAITADAKAAQSRGAP